MRTLPPLHPPHSDPHAPRPRPLPPAPPLQRDYRPAHAEVEGKMARAASHIRGGPAVNQPGMSNSLGHTEIFM